MNNLPIRCCILVAIVSATLIFSSPAFGQDTTDMLSKALDLVHQVENPVGNPPADAQRIELLTQAIKTAQEAPNHRLKGHRVLAIQAIRSAITEIREGDPKRQAVIYLHTADTELSASISLAGAAEPADANITNTTSTTNATAATQPTSISPGTADEMMQVVEDGDSDKVKALLQENPDLVFSKDKDGETPLIWAAIEGHRDVAEVLLAHKADVNARSPCGQTALNSAAMNGHEDVAELLLAHHADLNARAKDGQPPLDWAVDNGRLDMVKFLLAQGADVNAKANDGSTPLRLAELNHNYDVATYLRQHGGQEPPGVVDTGTLPQTGDASTDPANLEAAARAGDLEKVKALIKADPNSLFDTVGGQYAPLVAAAWANHKDVVEFLLANKADINIRNEAGMTALCCAAQGGFVDVAELLIAHGADLNARDKIGETPLYAAFQMSHKDMAALLLANKADPNIGNSSGLTPLYYAALMDQKDMVELLLAHGADVNAKGEQGSALAGDTPLYIAACNGLTDVVKVLLAHGANPNIKGHDGLTPLEIAVKNHHDTAEVPENDVADLLRPPAPQPPVNPIVTPPPGVTPEMEQAFLAKYKVALEKPDPDAYMALVANDPHMDPKAKEDMKGLELFGVAMTLSNPNRTYAFVPVTSIPVTGSDNNSTELAGKMYDGYLPPVIALKITFGKPAHSSPDAPVAVGDTFLPLCIENHQLMLAGLKEIPGAVPPPAVDKAANFGIEPNLRKLSDKAESEGENGFTSLQEFITSLKQPSVEILDSGETKYEYYAICRIAPNLCVWAGGDKVGEGNYSFYFRATDSNKQELKGSQKWIRLVDVPTDNGQAPNVQGTVFSVPDHYTGPITIDPHYSDDAGNKISSVSRTVDWK